VSSIHRKFLANFGPLFQEAQIFDYGYLRHFKPILMKFGLVRGFCGVASSKNFGELWPTFSGGTNFVDQIWVQSFKVHRLVIRIQGQTFDQ